MRRRIAVVVIAVAAAVAVTACGSSKQPASGGGASTSTPAAFEVQNQPPGQLVGGRVVVEIKDLQFNPPNLTIPAGATVVWSNLDNVAHTVTKKSGPGPDFDSGPISPGGTFQQVLPKAGRVVVYDKVRQNMVMNITVEKQVP